MASYEKEYQRIQERAINERVVDNDADSSEIFVSVCQDKSAELLILLEVFRVEVTRHYNENCPELLPEDTFLVEILPAFLDVLTKFNNEIHDITAS